MEQFGIRNKETATHEALQVFACGCCCGALCLHLLQQAEPETEEAAAAAAAASSKKQLELIAVLIAF